MQKSTVEFWFDPVCPWTWITSRWMAEVNEKENLDVIWQPFSLRILNVDMSGDNPHPHHQPGHDMGKLFSAVQKLHGNEKVADLYAEIGKRIHVDQRDDFTEIISESLAAADLAASLAADSLSDEYETILKESTERGVKLVGPGVGIPIIAIDEKAFFGPVVSPAPKGEDAINLWKAVSISINTPGFSELKRGRDGGLQFD